LGVLLTRVRNKGTGDAGSTWPSDRTRSNTDMSRPSRRDVGGSVIEYDVSKDGRRFLMNTFVEQALAPIALVLNKKW
jgi:hypothetical protein